MFLRCFFRSAFAYRFELQVVLQPEFALVEPAEAIDLVLIFAADLNFGGANGFFVVFGELELVSVTRMGSGEGVHHASLNHGEVEIA